MGSRLLLLSLLVALTSATAHAQTRPKYRRVLKKGKWVMVEWRDGAYRPIEEAPREHTTPGRGPRAQRQARVAGAEGELPSPWPWERPEELEYHEEVMKLLEFDIGLAHIRGEWDRVLDFFQQIRTLAHDTRANDDAPALAVSPDTYRLASEALRRRGHLVGFLRVQDGYLPLLRPEDVRTPEVLTELDLVLHAYHTPITKPAGVPQLHADVATLRTWLSTSPPPKALDDAAARARGRALQRLEGLRLSLNELAHGRTRLRERWPKMTGRILYHREMAERREARAEERQLQDEARQARAAVEES